MKGKILLATLLFMVSLVIASPIMTDDFNRVGDLVGSTTSDGKYIWSTNGSGATNPPSTNGATLNFNGSGYIAYINSTDMRHADFEISFDYIWALTYSDNKSLLINYRVDNPWDTLLNGGQQSGYTLAIKRTTDTALYLAINEDIGGVFTSQTSTTATVTGGWLNTTHIDLVVEGESHMIYVNSVLALSWSDSSYTSAGYWNFDDDGSRPRQIDNLAYSIPEPLTMVLLAMGLSANIIRKQK